MDSPLWSLYPVDGDGEPVYEYAAPSRQEYESDLRWGLIDLLLDDGQHDVLRDWARALAESTADWAGGELRPRARRMLRDCQSISLPTRIGFHDGLLTEVAGLAVCMGQNPTLDALAFLAAYAAVHPSVAVAARDTFRLHEWWLRRGGWHALEYASVERAVQAVRTASEDILLASINLPKGAAP